MNFAEIFTKDFLFNWQGRINRQRYWTYVLANIGVGVLAMIIDAMLTGGLAYMVFALASIFPSIVVGIKRWHDRDKSGWWMLILLVPVIGAIWYLVETGFLAGTPGPNRFGPDPLAGEALANAA